jgi:hypothetical protein
MRLTRRGKTSTHWINTLVLISLFFQRCVNNILVPYTCLNFKALKTKKVVGFFECMSFLDFSTDTGGTLFNLAGLHKEPDTELCCFMLKITGKHIKHTSRPQSFKLWHCRMNNTENERNNALSAISVMG